MVGLKQLFDILIASAQWPAKFVAPDDLIALNICIILLWAPFLSLALAFFHRRTVLGRRDLTIQSLAFILLVQPIPFEGAVALPSIALAYLANVLSYEYLTRGWRTRRKELMARVLDVTEIECEVAPAAPKISPIYSIVLIACAYVIPFAHAVTWKFALVKLGMNALDVVLISAILVSVAAALVSVEWSKAETRAERPRVRVWLLLGWLIVPFLWWILPGLGYLYLAIFGARR